MRPWLPCSCVSSSRGRRRALRLDRVAHHARVLVGRPPLVDRPGRLRLGLRRPQAGSTPRLLLMAVLVTLWGARLTFNFARKGGYAGRRGLPLAGAARAHDAVRSSSCSTCSSSSIYQNAYPAAHRLPAFTASRTGTRRSARSDVALAVVLPRLPRRRDHRRPAAVGLPPAEGERARGRPLAAAAVPADRAVPRARGTRTSSSSRRSGGSSSASRSRRRRAAAVDASLGAVLLTALFIGSTIFTESISRSKYPEYADYQARTSRPLIPWFPRSSRGDSASAPPDAPVRPARRAWATTRRIADAGRARRRDRRRSIGARCSRGR